MNQDRPARAGRQPLSRRAVLGGIAGAGAIAALAVASLPASRAIAQRVHLPQVQATPTADAPLTVVLVHGAWSDGSSWAGVIRALLEAGVSVVAAPNPLRGLSGDAAYIASVISQIPSPVLLVGHSYGGAVITNAASRADNVVGLVYVAAIIPDEGERARDLTGQASDRPVLRPAQYPTGDGEEPGIELSLDPVVFPEVLAGDLPAEQAAVMAVSQRPAAQAVFIEPSGPPAWKTLPSWAVVARQDQAIEPDAARTMAERAGAAITEIDGSHMVMISHPQAVADVILTAVAALS